MVQYLAIASEISATKYKECEWQVICVNLSAILGNTQSLIYMFQEQMWCTWSMAHVKALDISNCANKSQTVCMAWCHKRINWQIHIFLDCFKAIHWCPLSHMDIEAGFYRCNGFFCSYRPCIGPACILSPILYFMWAHDCCFKPVLSKCESIF